MTKIERLKEKLESLEKLRGQYMRKGRYSELFALNEDIDKLRTSIQDAEEYGKPKPLTKILSREEIAESGIIPILIECNLAADFLTDCACTLKEAISNLGLKPVTIVPQLDELIKKSDLFATILSSCGNDRLANMLYDNETLIAALHKKTLSYIEQRSRIQK